MKYTAFLISLLSLGLLAYAGEKNQTFPAKKGGTIQVHADGGSITVRGWEKEEVAVRVRSASEKQLQKVTMSQGGGKIVVEFNWHEGEVEDMEFDINVPSSFNTDLRTAGGELRFFAPLSGNIQAETAGGDIALGSIGGAIHVSTAGGEIGGENIAGDLNIRTAGGDIQIRSITGSIEASSAGGEIDIGDVGKSFQVSTAGGDMNIGKVGGNLQASTAGGSIRLRAGAGTVQLSTAGGDIDVGNCTGKLSVQTSAGNVTVTRMEGMISARTTAGDISVSLDPSPGESSSLATSAGSVTLMINASAKATITARTHGPFGDEDGDIESDFPITRPGGRHKFPEGEVILNGGGHRVTLETMVGSISIRKQK